MRNIAVIGIQLGDEGKGKVVHSFSKNYDWVIRWSGGANCGHTIYVDGKKFVHHLVPSIDFNNSKAKGFLASGMVIDLQELYDELLSLEKEIPGIASRIVVDPDAFLVLPAHKEEDKAKNQHIGTTNKGIGPAYRDKMARVGMRICDYIKDNHPIINSLKQLGVEFKYVMELENNLKNSALLFEGAQGMLLDINQGIYPYVSCGDATLAGIFSSGFAFAMPTKVYGVSKCYSTRVGTGPFPTEIFNEEANKLREAGGEYGATTGRPRRIGWLDLPALKYACKKGAITDLIITKLDILNGWQDVPVCTGYQKEPVCTADFALAKPVYTNVKGWRNAKNDEEIYNFVSEVEQYTGIPVSHISSGVNKDDLRSY